MLKPEVLKYHIEGGLTLRKEPNQESIVKRLLQIATGNHQPLDLTCIALIQGGDACISVEALNFIFL